ncbi:MAG: S-layer homology domain-containing protein, partial [Clostridia bacterium]|nr:S-layer homology domain-containing protein [Clostridia bacterium]
PSVKTAEISHFTDRATFSDWAVAPIAKAVNLGLVAGNPDGSFNAKGNATRAEAAVIMFRLLKLL